MSDVYVVGVGMTRFGKFFDTSVKELTEEAATSALGDAGPGEYGGRRVHSRTDARADNQEDPDPPDG